MINASKYISSTYILYYLVALYAISLPIFSYNTELYMYSNYIFVAMAGYWFFELILSRKIIFIYNSITSFLLAFVLYFYAQSLIYSDFDASFGKITALVALFLAFNIVSSVIYRVGSATLIIRSIGLGVLIVSLQMMYENSFSGIVMRGSESQSALIENTNAYGKLIFVSSVLLFMDYYKSKGRLYKIFFFMVIAINVYFVFMMLGSRQSFVVMTLLILVVFYNWIFTIKNNGSNKNLLKISKFLLGVIALYSVMSYFSENSRYLDRVVNIINPILNNEVLNENSANKRLELIDKGVELWSKSPLFGSGVNYFRVHSGFYTYTHNNYIELLVSGGIISLVIWYGIFSLLIHKVIVKMKINRSDNRRERLLLLGIIGVLLLDIVSVSYSDKVIWLFMSIAFTVTHRKFVHRSHGIN
jgi:O-antigen ligase